MLPSTVTIGSNTYFLQCEKMSDCWYTSYPGTKKIMYEKAETEADARAKMLIYLLENQLINFK